MRLSPSSSRHQNSAHSPQARQVPGGPRLRPRPAARQEALARAHERGQGGRPLRRRRGGGHSAPEPKASTFCRSGRPKFHISLLPHSLCAFLCPPPALARPSASFPLSSAAPRLLLLLPPLPFASVLPLLSSVCSPRLPPVPFLPSPFAFISLPLPLLATLRSTFSRAPPFPTTAGLQRNVLRTSLDGRSAVVLFHALDVAPRA